MDRIYVMELVRSFQVGGISRRTFLTRATAALGSAAAASTLLAACQPLPAQAPRPVVEAEATTVPQEEMASAGGLVTGTVEYPNGAGGDALMGYMARPEGDESLPAVIVLQEWWGLNDHIKEVTNRFAAAGYVALAPDLYHGVVASEPDEARKLVMELDMAGAVGEIQSAIDHLLAQENVAGDSSGIVGFCMGGRLVLATALASDDLGAAVAFYGSPLSAEEAASVKAPVMGHYGADDGGIPVDAVQAMGSSFDEAGIENEIYIYEGAPHAFFNDTRDSYRPESADQAWERTLGWFADHL